MFPVSLSDVCGACAVLVAFGLSACLVCHPFLFFVERETERLQSQADGTHRALGRDHGSQGSPPLVKQALYEKTIAIPCCIYMRLILRTLSR